MDQQVNVVESELVLFHEEAPLAASLVDHSRTALAARIMELESQGLAIAEGLIGIQITDQATYDDAASKILAGKAFLEDAGGFFEPFRKITFALYNMVIERKKSVLTAPQKAVTAGSEEVLRFEREQEELRRRQQREGEERARREEEERRLQAAVAAEQAGLGEQAKEEILTAPVTTPTPVAAPTFQKAAGLSSREAWCAEVTDLWALVKAVAKDKKLLPLVEANMPALNAQARSLKTAMQIPGVRAVDKGSLARQGAGGLAERGVRS